MALSAEERRALAFVAFLVVLSAGVRVAATPAAVDIEGSAVDVEELESGSAEAAAENERRSQPLGEDERIDPNRAPEEELDRLPGVGPALAERMVAAREAGPPFASVTDLERVAGIGASTAARIEPHVDFSAVPPAAVGSRSADHRRARAQGARPRSAAGAAEAPTRVDPNRAGAAELQRLPGVGPVLAERIIEERNSGGRFERASDLERVPGIGSATREKLAPLLRFRR